MSQQITSTQDNSNPELRAKVKQLMSHNRKRAFEMFQATSVDPVESFEEAAAQLKVQRHYSNVGRVPNIQIQEAQRVKLLKELGVTKADSKLQVKLKDTNEEVKQLQTDLNLGQSGLPQQTIKAITSGQPPNQLSIQFNKQEEPKVESQQKPKEEPKTKKTEATDLQLSLLTALNENQQALVLREKKQIDVQWHAPWKLKRVIAGHTGWVRSIAVDPLNKFFATGSGDRTIKFWDLITGQLKLTLTGHVNTVRGLAISARHPYLFSCGEDKQVKCWDLEQNKVVRQYHGHLSGVYAIALHPKLDLLVTGGRDSTARVWDMRTKQQVHVLAGHANTIEDIICQNDEPQVITGSHDKMIRMWDIRTGQTVKTLTHHKKGIRAMVNHHQEHTFASAAADQIRIWKQPEGDQLRTIANEDNHVINSLALNEDNVLVSGGDNGMLKFYDWKSGHCFQQFQSPVQPGSLSSEAAVFDIKFDKSSLRMITAECDKTIKIWKEDEEATPESHPVLINQH